MRGNKTSFIETLEIVSSAMIIAAIIVGIQLYF
jgi:hypothetical protein